MKPLVSILIPAYNAAPWIAETIRSALAQTWAAKEIIVAVDDGCRDETLAVARQFASKTVAVVPHPHLCAAAARNQAYAACQGDYIQWLDADDLLSPDKIALQMHSAEQSAAPKTLLSCAWAFFNSTAAPALKKLVKACPVKNETANSKCPLRAERRSARQSLWRRLGL